MCRQPFLAAGSAASLIVVIGCSAPKLNAPNALINDVSIPENLNTGFRVEQVDAQPPRRLESHIDTVVPYVVVQPGHHTLTLTPSSDSVGPKQRTTVSANFEEGKCYRIANQNGTITVIEEPD